MQLYNDLIVPKSDNEYETDEDEDEDEDFDLL